jgi:hypothetical protein
MYVDFPRWYHLSRKSRLLTWRQGRRSERRLTGVSMKKVPLFKVTPLFLLPRPWDPAAERFLEKVTDVPRLPEWAAHKRCRDCGADSFHCPTCGTKIAFADTVLEIHEGDCLHCRREVSAPCKQGRARSFLQGLTGK